MKMVHWLTLEETELQVTSDDGGVKLDAPDDGTVHVSLRSDYAAAPKLLEACRAMFLACATDGVRRVLGPEYDAAFNLARAAIAEADPQR